RRRRHRRLGDHARAGPSGTDRLGPGGARVGGTRDGPRRRGVRPDPTSPMVGADQAPRPVHRWRQECPQTVSPDLHVRRSSLDRNRPPAGRVGSRWPAGSRSAAPLPPRPRSGGGGSACPGELVLTVLWSGSDGKTVRSGPQKRTATSPPATGCGYLPSLARRAARSSAARSRSIDSGSSPLRRLALTSPSVTYGPYLPERTVTFLPLTGSLPSSLI